MDFLCSISEIPVYMVAESRGEPHVRFTDETQECTEYTEEYQEMFNRMYDLMESHLNTLLNIHPKL